MPKSIHIAIFVCLCFTSMAFAQHTLDEFPIQVGGYITDDGGLPIENASITFIDQSTMDEYQGTTDTSGWYGNLGYSSVPDIPTSSILGNAYPNPFGNSTSIDIQSDGPEKNSNSGEIKIFDLRGRKVGSIPSTSGTHEVKTTSGALANGTYFYRFAGEAKKMVGSPKFISIKTTSSSSGEKSLVEYGVQISAVGYENLNWSIDLDDTQINYRNFSLDRTSIEKTLFGDVWDITGDNPLIGTLKIINASGEITTTTTDESGGFSLDYLVSCDDESIRVFFEAPGYTNQTGAMIDPTQLVVAGGRIDASASFVEPDTVTVASDDARLTNAVRLQYASDETVDDSDIRTMLGAIFNRNGPYETEILSNFMDADTWITAGPIPSYLMDRFTTVVEGIQDENSQSNGTQLNEMSYVINATPSYRPNDIHYLHGDETTGGAWNIRGPADAEGHLTAPTAWVSPDTPTGTVAAEMYGSFLNDVNDSMSAALRPDTSGRLGEKGSVAYSLHHLLDNGTDCNPWQ